jgi:hypothetical protein
MDIADLVEKLKAAIGQLSNFGWQSLTRFFLKKFQWPSFLCPRRVSP